MCWKPLLLVFFLSYSPVINSDLIHSDNVFRTKDRAETCVKDCDSEKDCYINRTRCLDGKCGCVHNYQFNSNCSRCIKCPGLDSKCNTQCCYGSDLYCNPGSGKCESCIKDGKYICRSILHDDLQSENIEARSDSNQNQDLLMTATQIAMSGALTLGIITILILFWKLCAKTERRRQGRSGRGPRASNDSAASGGSLQRAVAERMRDAPPPYCRALPPPGDTPPPYHTVNNSGYVNASFEGDFSLPPPDYNIAVGDSSSSISSTTPSTEQQAKSITSESHQNVEAKNTEIVSNSTTLHI